MDNPEKFRVLEWCAGYGGIGLGLKRAIPNMLTVAFSEIEAYACANLVAKMEEGLLDPAPIWTDIKTFPNEEFRGKIDMLIAGFPCQPFSCAGKRDGTEDPRHLWPYIEKSVELIQPRFCYFENVEGIYSAKTLDHRPKLKEYCQKAGERLGGQWGAKMFATLQRECGISVLHYVIHRLERLGYTVEADIFSAEECGAPHRRKRVFILAHRNGERIEKPSGRVTTKQELYTSGDYGPYWPARPGQEQHEWEPPRVLANPTASDDRRCDTGTPERQRTEHGEGCSSIRVERQTKPQMGGNANGCQNRLDHAELYQSTDNRTDELRLLGNGVVGATAELAFRILYNRLKGLS